VKERYEEFVNCELCGEQMGFAPYMREAYQCTDCNSRLPKVEMEDDELPLSGGWELPDDD